MNLKSTVFLWALLYAWTATSISVALAQDAPAQTTLIPSPRQAFTPTPTSVRGYWNIDVVGDFTLPATKSITWSGAGRNLHVNQDWSKLFRRGFSAIERSRMTSDEIGIEPNARLGRSAKFNKSATWRSRLTPDQRALIIYQNYFTGWPFNLQWAQNSDMARYTYFEQPPGSTTPRESIGNAMAELDGGCVAFNDCPPGSQANTFGKIFFDIENEGTSPGNEQEHANMYVYKMWMLRKSISPYTEIGGIGPVPHNSYGNSRTSDYRAGFDWLWSMPANQISATNTRGRGMPDDIVGKSFSDLTDFQMPGTYYLYSDFDYAASHNGDGDRHWLASLLGEQEVNMKLSPKKRIAWQWLFNTQSAEVNQATRAEYPAPPNIAEGMGIFYWFTGAHGAILWDDWNELTPNAPVQPGRENLDNNRYYGCYEHYIHGLWRLFKHNGDLFNGQEKYLNDQTECSYDNGKTWYRLNANALKRSGRPFARVIVNGNQILVAASQAYAAPDQQTQLMVRYVQDGYRFYSTINLRGDEIYLGRATMPTGSDPVTPSQTSIDPMPTPPLAATVVGYDCASGVISMKVIGGKGGPAEFMSPGITDWSTRLTYTLDPGLRADPKLLTIYIRQNGEAGIPAVFDFRAYCTGAPQPAPNTAPTVANPPGLQSATVGLAYNFNIGNVFADAQTPNALTLTATGLPAGLNLNGTTITGTPSASGVSTITLKASDPGFMSTTTTFSLVVSNNSGKPIVQGPLAATVVSYDCSTGALTLGSTGGNNTTVEFQSIGITGWTSRTQITIDAGLRADPKPITIDIRQSGAAGASFVFDLKAYCSAPVQPPVNTAPTVANPVGPQSATVGTAYTLNVGTVFTDAQSPNQLTLSATGLPAGLSLNGTTISGTPSVAGASTVTLKATDPGSLTATTSFQLTATPVSSTTAPVGVIPTVINPVGPQSATVGIGYSLNLGNVFTDAQSPEALTLTVTGAPAGLNFNGGVLSGTPSATGVSTIVLRATNPGSLSAITAFQLTVNPAAEVAPGNTAPTIARSVPPQSVTVGTTFGLDLNGVFTDKETPGQLTLSASGLPAGLNLDRATLSGTPSVTGTSTITIKATDPGNLTATISFQLTVRPVNVVVTPTNTAPTVANTVAPQSATVGVGYSLNVGNVFTDAETPAQLTLSASGLPAGLSLAGTTISGLPSVTGVSTVTLKATDPANLSTSAIFVLTISPSANKPTIEGPLAATVVSYNCKTGAIVLGAVGGNGAPIEFMSIGITGWTTKQSHTIEDGLRFDPKPLTIRIRQDGVEGTSFTFDLKAYCNSAPTTPVNTAPTVANDVKSQSATVGATYSLNVSNVFTDAETPTSLTVSVSGLPAGLTFNGGTISGTPSATGVSTVTLKATDAGGQSGSTTFLLSVVPVTPTNTAPSVANAVSSQSATLGASFSLNLANVFADAETPSQLSLSATGLPAGLTLTGATLSGTASATGVSTVTLKATDPGNLTATTSFQLTVTTVVPANTAPSVKAPVGPRSATVGTGFSLNLSTVFTDAETPGQLFLSATGLPAGLNLNGTTLTGIPSATGVSTVTLKATDPGSLTATTSFQLTVMAAPTAPPSSTTATSTSCGSPASTIGQTLQITGVTDVNCQNGSFRILTSGGNGSQINYANIVGLSNANPSSCVRMLDNPDLIRAISNPSSDINPFQLRVTQGSVQSTSFTFNFKQYCTSTARIATETEPDLDVQVLGNPTPTNWVEVEVRQAQPKPLTFRVLDAQGNLLNQQEVEPNTNKIRQRIDLGGQTGIYILQVNSSTQTKSTKIIRQ